MSERNWSWHHTFNTTRVHYPETVGQLQEVVRQSKNVKALGSRHSFNHIADASEDLISLEKLDQTVTVDREKQTAIVPAGITYGELGRQLHGAGFGIRNMASLPQITVAGACATGTHGSGDENGCLATQVAAVELVRADGSIASLSRDEHGELFSGCMVALGGLGVVTKFTLELVPTFNLCQFAYENLPVEQIYEHFDEITSGAYSISFFTLWQNERVDQVWLKIPAADSTTAAPQPTFFEGKPASSHLHPIAGLPAEGCTPRKWAYPDPGMSGYRTSGKTTFRMRGKSCSQNTSCRESTLSAPCVRWLKYKHTSLRSLWFRRCALSRRTNSG